MIVDNGQLRWKSISVANTCLASVNYPMQFRNAEEAQEMGLVVYGWRRWGLELV